MVYKADVTNLIKYVVGHSFSRHIFNLCPKYFGIACGTRSGDVKDSLTIKSIVHHHSAVR